MNRHALLLLTLLTACTVKSQGPGVSWQRGDWPALILQICQEMTAVTSPELLARTLGPHETDPLNGPGFLRLTALPPAVNSTLIYTSEPLDALVFDVDLSPGQGPTVRSLQQALGVATELPAATESGGQAALGFRTIQAGRPCVVSAAVRREDMQVQPTDQAEQISIHIEAE